MSDICIMTRIVVRGSMKNNSIEIASIALAIGVALSGIAGYGVHHRTRKSGCRHACAQTCIDENLDSDNPLYYNAFSDFKQTATTENIGLFSHAKSAYVMDFGSGTLVFQKESLKRLPIASMCKIMTLLLTFEAIDSGVISFNDMVIVSEHAASMGGSQVFLEENAKYPVSELIKSIVVCSANDSCVAMAEKICGSDTIFVSKMNERAKELGCENTLFANCTGLPKEPQYSCAKDVAIMLKALLSHEKYYEYAKTWTDVFQHPEGRTTEISNTNRLVRFYDGCDGGKTGFTNEAGYCLAATAKRGDLRVISVVIGEADSKTRFKEVSESFDYTFANYTVEKTLDSSKALSELIPVSGGKEKTLPIRPIRDGYFFVKRGEKGKIHTEIEIAKSLKAPIKAGEEVGFARIFQDGVEYDCIPLVATVDIDKASYFDLLKEISCDWNLCGW